MLYGKSAKYGEHLRMSLHDNSRDDVARAMKRELDELSSQTEEDWVEMHIFSEWSHGYMQMSRLMAEARTVINDVADWMDAVFESRRGRASGRKSAWEKRKATAQLERAAAAAVHTDDASTPFASETEVETDDALTFAPKKRSPPSSFSGSSDQSGGSPSSAPPRPQQLSKSAGGSSDSTAQSRGSDPGDEGEAAVPNGVAHQPIPVSAQDILHGTVIAMPPQAQANGSAGKSGSGLSRLPSPPAGKGGSPGKAGQKISESELMRRRRLLDSHLISSDLSPK